MGGSYIGASSPKGAQTALQIFERILEGHRAGTVGMVGARVLFHMEIAVADIIAFSLVPLAQEVGYPSKSAAAVRPKSRPP